jgi:hypothetical protein
MNTISQKNEYDTVNSNNERSSVRKSISKSNNKSANRGASRSANKNVSLNISTINHHARGQNISSEFNINYTPLRSSPPKKTFSNSKSHKKGTHSKKRSSASKYADDFKPPSIIHEQVVTSLRREKDSLQLALS